MVQDLSYNLCESLVDNIDGVAGVGKKKPTPIIYLTQWKIVGNSEVHTDPYLTSWKVSGNSVVDNNTILSCGDLGQDGKYHVKISNGVTIYDIPLDAPLRKVNDVADTIEFPSDTEGKALVTRNLRSVDLGTITPSAMTTNMTNKYRFSFKVNNIKTFSSDKTGNILCATLTARNSSNTYSCINNTISISSIPSIMIYKEDYADKSAQEVQAAVDGVIAIYELATPTTELVDVSPFPVSATDTYTSANVTPYSAFEYKKNVEIWSCGEYNPTDGKYHILVQPLGGSIADIALDAPLRKVNNVADSIEFPSSTEGKALVTRNLRKYKLADLVWQRHIYNGKYGYTTLNLKEILVPPINNTTTDWNAMCNRYNISNANNAYGLFKECIGCGKEGDISISDYNYIGADDFKTFKTSLQENDVELIITLISPTTELVDAPQIAEADSYSMVISQGAKAVEWSSFETE